VDYDPETAAQAIEDFVMERLRGQRTVKLALSGAKDLIPVYQKLAESRRIPWSRVIVFLAVWLICQLISAVLSGMLSLVGLGIFNRILGGVFGLTRAALSLMVLTIIVGLTPAASYPLWQSSWVVQMAKQGIVFFKPFLPAPLEGWVF
jgi:uncharacterized membrane protein required for colicin V production